MDIEKWLPIPQYEGLYEVSNFGNVRSVDRIVGGMGDHRLKGKGKSFCLSGSKTKKYYYVNLYKNGKGHLYSVHRLVAKLFVPNPDGHDVVNHIDLNNLNNHYTNLEWCNLRENSSHGGRQKNPYPVGVQKYEGKRITSWVASIGVNGSTIYLGTFPTMQQAQDAYRKALLNFKLQNKYA